MSDTTQESPDEGAQMPKESAWASIKSKLRKFLAFIVVHRVTLMFFFKFVALVYRAATFLYKLIKFFFDSF